MSQYKILYCYSGLGSWARGWACWTHRQALGARLGAQAEHWGAQATGATGARARAGVRASAGARARADAQAAGAQGAQAAVCAAGATGVGARGAGRGRACGCRLGVLGWVSWAKLVHSAPGSVLTQFLEPV